MKTKIAYLKLALLLSVFIMLANPANAQLISKKEFRLKESRINNIELIKDYKLTSKSSVSKSNSPFLAGTLSFIVPGAALGQLYNGQYVNFGVRIGISAFCIAWLSTVEFDFGGAGKGTDAVFPLLILYTANWITSIVDAVIYNKKHLSWR